MKPVRVGLIGARRARQGLGPFLARDLRAAGAEVPCYQVARTTSLAQADRELREIAGVEARGYTDLSALIANESLDALVVSSPHETHAAVILAAAEARLHVLCEKPLVWGEDDLGERARDCVAACEKRGLELWENCQWPYTLPAFEKLHPGRANAPPRSFAMRLQPAGPGAKMLADSLPHPLSLLQRLLPGDGPHVTDISISTTPDASHVGVRFRYHAGGDEIACDVELRPTQSHPREVAFAIDGHQATRRISGPDYALSFADDERSVPLEDPMTLLVADFVAMLQQGGSPTAHERHREIVDRVTLLDSLRAAWPGPPD